ncbi:MAG: hypothetical protein J2P17_24690 [Mycobacterium sp.]|nr:hypothetical protein [Mycobacterium sp.]
MTVRTPALDFGGPTTMPWPGISTCARVTRSEPQSSAMSHRRSAVTSPHRSEANAVSWINMFQTYTESFETVWSQAKKPKW